MCGLAPSHLPKYPAKSYDDMEKDDGGCNVKDGFFGHN
jgi:hypothetical protein